MPLSYLRSRCVLEYMEANQRYLLAARCPSLRGLHQSSPLSIQSIKMSKTSIVINDFEHSFHCLVAPKYEGQELPVLIQERNARGGSPFDLTEFGYIDARIYVEGTKHEHSDGEELHRVCMGAYKRGGPVYATYITYSIQRFGGLKKSVRYASGIKIRDAFKAFLQNFMGGPRIPNVGCLEVNPQRDTKIPSGLKFKVREVRLPNNSSSGHLPTIGRLLDPTCLPLEKVIVTSWEVTPFLPSRHPILYTSLYLEIQRYHGPLLAPPIDELGVAPQRTLPWSNKNVYVRDETIRMHELIEFVQKWSEQPRDVGTKFSFRRPNFASCVELIHSVGGTQTTIPSRRCPEIPHATNFRIRAGLELNLYGAEAPGSLQGHKSWMLVMEYMEEGSAVPVNN